MTYHAIGDIHINEIARDIDIWDINSEARYKFLKDYSKVDIYDISLNIIMNMDDFVFRCKHTKKKSNVTFIDRSDMPERSDLSYLSRIIRW